MKTPGYNRYIIKSLVHAAAVLGCFKHQGESLRLRDVVSRTGLKKGMCFRLLYTLHQCGFLEKIDENSYRLLVELHRPRKYRFGYAGQGQFDASFHREVRTGLVRAAEEMGVELIALDNRYNPRVALRNADHLVKEGVDLVIEFQADESVAPAIAAKYLEAGIPFIAIDIPHPGATYFGANNYEAGLMAGRHLGRWARKSWEGKVDEILLIELARAGSVPQARIRGMVTGIHETIRVPDSVSPYVIDGDGQFQTSLEGIRRHLRESRASRILVGAATDSSALGALRAFEEAGRLKDCAIVGQNGEPEARFELRNPDSRFIGTVAYFPEKYGAELVQLAIHLLEQRPVPPAVFVKHQLITPENVDHFYPNDRLLDTGTSGELR
jgi:ribose transport system substrate-binding protein